MPHSGRTTELNLPHMAQGNTASGEGFRREAQGVENQLVELADAWGPGVLGSGSWAVSEGETPLTVSVAAGSGLVGRFAGVTEQPQTLAVEDDTTQFVWATPTVEDAEVAQAWLGEPTFVLYPAADGYDGTVLAEVTAVAGELTITDLRRQIGRDFLKAILDQHGDDIAWLAAALGADYAEFAAGGSLATVDARLDALEAGLAGSGAVTVYWALLEASASDSRTIPEWHEDWHAAMDEARAGQVVVTDDDAIGASLLGELLREVGLHGNPAIANQRGVWAFHAGTSPDSMYDKPNSTAHPDRLEEVIR